MNKMIKCMNDTGLNRSLLKCLFTQIFCVCLLSIGILNAQQSQLGRPQIIDIKITQDEVLVRAFVPEGYKQVFVEGKPRFEVGAWVPRAVIYTEGKKGEYEFRLSVSEKIEWLRIRAESEIPVPETAFLGESDFVGPAANDENVLFDAMPVATPDRTGDLTEGAADEKREVVESDIWRLEGDRMYFFNQYRGLQIVDLSNVEQPQLLGEMELPAAGEQMYLVDAGHAVLLARNSCSYWSGDAESRLVIVDVSGTDPIEIASVPVEGRIQDSRLVGTALYVTTQVYRHRTESEGGVDEEIWEWGSQVVSYDLSQPAFPVEMDSIWVPGFQNVIQATSEFLFVSTQGSLRRDRGRSTLKIIDIGQADGAMTELSEIRPAGRILDKFKINMHGKILRVISELPLRPLQTDLETFDLTNPKRPFKLGAVTLGENESLHATRFDGDKAYIVTFFRVDPLWVVDLSDPANPTISGELEVPGWSTYIQPLGDQLLSIGIDNVKGWRVSVSLFDVADPAKPGLLSRVPIGNHYSWSEANHDEKAFGWIEEAGLILVPFQSYEESGSMAGVQLIDLKGDALQKRGVIEHTVAPRRSALKDDVILSLSGRSLMAVDATDRDRPELVSELTLSWRVDEVFSVGDHVLQLTKGSQWNSENAALRVGEADKDFQFLTELDLGSMPVVGTAMRGETLFIAQTSTTGVPVPTAEGEKPGPETFSFLMSAVDLSKLPDLQLLSKQEIQLENPVFGSDLQALWISDDHLVWQSSQDDWFWGNDVVFDGPARGIADIGFWPGGFSGSRFLAFDTDSADGVQFLSDFDLAVENVWNFSDGHAVDGKIYISYQKSELDEPAPGRPEELVIKGRWIQKNFLAVVDYADPIHPTQRPAVNIPGSLMGISHGGNVIFTKGMHYDQETLVTNNREWLDALAYDGVAAHLMDSIAYSSQWPHLAEVTRQGYVIAGQIQEDKNEDDHSLTDNLPGLYTLGSWFINDEGNFERQDPLWNLPFGASDLKLMDDQLLLRQGQEVWGFNIEESGALQLQSVYEPFGCYWFNLSGTVVDEGEHLWVPASDYGADRLSPTSPDRPLVRVSGGTFFGECEGYCKTSIHIEPTRTTFTASALDQSVPTYRQYAYGPNNWSSIADMVDWNVFSELPEIVGCLDCADGGGEWIEVNVAGESHRVTFENGINIDAIQPLIERIRSLRGDFKIPEPKIDSVNYIRIESDCEDLCRRRIHINQSTSRWTLSDPLGVLRAKNHSERTPTLDWDRLDSLIDWRVVQDLASRELAICHSCPGTEWIEIAGGNQIYVIPAWFEEVSALKGFLLSMLNKYQIKPEPEAITRIEYGSNFGFCFDYCTKQSLAEKQILQLSATSRQADQPPIEQVMEIGLPDWEHLLILAEHSEIEGFKEVIGCPDCADGGSEWIRVWRGEDSRKVTFPYGEPPEPMAEMVDLMRGWVDTLPTKPEGGFEE